MNYETIEGGIEGRIAIAYLNRPQVLNAFDPVPCARRRTRRGAWPGRRRPRSWSAVRDAPSRQVRPEGGGGQAGQQDPEWRSVLEADFDFIMASGTAPSRPSPPSTATASAARSSCRSPATSRWRREGRVRRARGQVRLRRGRPAAAWIAGPKAAKELLLTGDDRLTPRARWRSGSSTTSCPTARSTRRRWRSPGHGVRGPTPSD